MAELKGLRDDVYRRPLATALAVNLGPIPLQPGTRYSWRLMIDGDSLPGASLGFTTRPRPDAP
jgi:hypothetical protein